MINFDIAILTDARYINPVDTTTYVQNILDEERLLAEALEAKGLKVVRVDWADPDFDWSTTRIAIFRTTWDYFERFNAFIEWLHQTKKVLRFINPVEQILWNLDKHYLQDLSVAGINIPETKYIEPGAETTLKKIFYAAGWTDAILKPAVSGAARHTYRLSAKNIGDYEAVFQQLITSESMLLQPFQQAVLKKGEVALMYFDGKYSHAVLKIAKPGDFRVQDDFGGTVHRYTPTKEEIELGENTLQLCKPIPVYARVDIIEDNNGKPAVSELELIEPELWFRLKPAAAKVMAEAILKHTAN
jgi:glutathione synthase/RimK-type ligase-like ATP-grasp enzyme